MSNSFLHAGYVHFTGDDITVKRHCAQRDLHIIKIGGADLYITEADAPKLIEKIRASLATEFKGDD